MSAITFSGLASGIDSSALIKSILDQKRKTQIEPLQTRISSLQETNSAFSELTSLLSKLQSAAAKFRTVNGGIIAKSAASSDETKISAAASNSAAAGSYTVTVSALAKNATHSFNDRFAGTSSVINANINNADPVEDRTVSYTIGTGPNQETVSIALTSSTTAADFVSAFNSQSTKATASLVNVGTGSSPSYAIVVSSNKQGTEEGSISVSVGARVTDPNNDADPDDGAFVTATESAAADSNLTVSGISGTIVRPGNSISDIIAGVTLNLQDIGTSTITVSNNASSTSSGLQAFVDAYNDIIKFVAQNDLVTREENGNDVRNVFGPLAGTSLDESIVGTLRSALSAAGISGRPVNILADFGITTERDGTLKFDTGKFNEAMNNDAEGISLITQKLGEDLSAVNGRIANFIRFNGLIDLAEASNSTEISRYEKRISDLEQALLKEQQSLTGRYARLEGLIGKLNSQQSVLTSLLPK